MNFIREIPLIFSDKKINPEIWPQKYPLRRWSWRPFFKKSSYQCDFENSWKFSQLHEKIKPTRIFSAFITIVIYTHIYLKYIPYYYQEIWTKKWHTIHKTKKNHHPPPTTKTSSWRPFFKNHPSSVILKKFEKFFNLMKKLNPQQFFVNLSL